MFWAIVSTLQWQRFLRRSPRHRFLCTAVSVLVKLFEKAGTFAIGTIPFLNKPLDSLRKAVPMRKTHPLLALAVLVSCTPTGAFLSELPEEVVALAAPNQDLQTARLLEEDGCYWYEHDGPVERTLLPLMSKRGRHICLQQRS